MGHTREDDDGIPIDYAARRKWEAENPGWKQAIKARYGSSWGKQHIGRKLTDRQIANYLKKGYYSEWFKSERMKKQKAPVGKREGNFIVMPDGSEIYSPL